MNKDNFYLVERVNIKFTNEFLKYSERLYAIMIICAFCAIVISALELFIFFEILNCFLK